MHFVIVTSTHYVHQFTLSTSPALGRLAVPKILKNITVNLFLETNKTISSLALSRKTILELHHEFTHSKELQQQQSLDCRLIGCTVCGMSKMMPTNDTHLDRQVLEIPIERDQYSMCLHLSIIFAYLSRGQHCTNKLILQVIFIKLVHDYLLIHLSCSFILTPQYVFFTVNRFASLAQLRFIVQCHFFVLIYPVVPIKFLRTILFQN